MNWFLAVTVVLASVLPLFTNAAPCCCCCCDGGGEEVGISSGFNDEPVDSAGRQRSAFGWLLKAGKMLFGGAGKRGVQGSAKVIKKGAKNIGDLAADLAAEEVSVATGPEGEVAEAVAVDAEEGGGGGEEAAAEGGAEGEGGGEEPPPEE